MHVIGFGPLLVLQELSLAGDDLMTWRLKLWHFDEDCKGGKNLNRDLEKLNKKYVRSMMCGVD